MSAGRHKHPLTAAGVLVALGIIYGDIGTSPLYVMKAILGDAPITERVVLGGVSCVIWTLTLQTTLKYVVLMLRADNRGEGGILSLYALVRRFAWWAFIPASVGAAAMLADGIITPPISVGSAIEGLGNVPALAHTFTPGGTITVAVVIAILSVIFFFQRFGTKVLGFAFGPVMALWFTMLLVLGVAAIAQHPEVIRAFDPRHAMVLLTEHPGGFWLLGAVFLCTTGAEALYNDLGHCGRENIRVGWVFVKVALVANYLGQAAWVLNDAGHTLDGRNPFYALMPHWALIPGVALATLAAIIASQALITGSFTLISEAISLNLWPRVRVKFPSDVRGQIYIPSINWLLYIGCVAIMLAFRESVEMGHLYGFFISLAMGMTTVLMGVWLRYVRHWPWAGVVALLVLFATIETAYFTANSVKIIGQPGLLVVVLALIAVMLIWYRARKTINRYLDFRDLPEYVPAITDLSRDKDVPKFATHLVYLTKANDPLQIERKIMDSILRRRPKRADIYWFLHVNWTDEPYTMDYRVTELVHDKVVRVDFDLGFRIQPRMNMLFKQVVQEMVEKQWMDFSSKYESLRKHDFAADIRYVLMDRFLSVENELSFQDDTLLDAYFFLKRLALSDQTAFGLDHTDTVVEQVPLVLTRQRPLPLKCHGHVRADRPE